MLKALFWSWGVEDDTGALKLGDTVPHLAIKKWKLQRFTFGSTKISTPTSPLKSLNLWSRYMRGGQGAREQPSKKNCSGDVFLVFFLRLHGVPIPRKIREIMLPSGKRLRSYRKSPCFMGKSTISMVMFQ